MTGQSLVLWLKHREGNPLTFNIGLRIPRRPIPGVLKIQNENCHGKWSEGPLLCASSALLDPPCPLPCTCKDLSVELKGRKPWMRS